jgi:hypothetical protein
MKTTFAILFALTTILSQAQFVKPQPKPIDLKLEQFRKEHAFGTGMQLVGAAICGLGYLAQRNNGKLYKPFYALGGTLALGGTITKMSSYRHLATDVQVK